MVRLPLRRNQRPSSSCVRRWPLPRHLGPQGMHERLRTRHGPHETFLNARHGADKIRTRMQPHRFGRKNSRNLLFAVRICPFDPKSITPSCAFSSASMRRDSADCARAFSRSTMSWMLCCMHSWILAGFRFRPCRPRVRGLHPAFGDAVGDGDGQGQRRMMRRVRKNVIAKASSSAAAVVPAIAYWKWSTAHTAWRRPTKLWSALSSISMSNWSRTAR